MGYVKLQHVNKIYYGNKIAAVNDFCLEIEKGEIITLLGPSGCGKTTTLRMIAGFENPSSGTIEIGGETVYSPTADVPPEKRGIGMVFQDYALFPHLTLEKNIMFGLKSWSSKERKSRVLEVMKMADLVDFADRYPHELSGGQQQRVALARAIAPRPKVILMDEPFSNLDASLREKMRYEVQQILRKAEMTAIIVTHDQKDAFAVSDRVVVMNEGSLQQISTPRDIYRNPKNTFVAKFLGKTNILTGEMAVDQKHVYTYMGKVCLPKKTEQFFPRVTLSIRPEGCKICDNGRFCGEVVNVTYGGEYQELQIKLKTKLNENTSMVIYAPIEYDYNSGDEISFDIAPELVALVD